MWYAETRRFDGKPSPATYADFPPDRSSDGRKYNYVIRVELSAEDSKLSVQELWEKVGSGRVMFRSIRSKTAA